MKKIIRSELELSKWFEKNFKKFGYSEIFRKDIGIFPDFIMLRKGKKVRVELETLASNFVRHKHNINKVDEIVCVNKDIDIGVTIIEIKDLKYIPKKIRRSFTIDEKVYDSLNSLTKKLVEKGKYRNKSHFVESALRSMIEQEKK